MWLEQRERGEGGALAGGRGESVGFRPSRAGRIFCRVQWESSRVLSRGVEESDFVLRESSWLLG